MMKGIAGIAGVGDPQVAPYDKMRNQEDKKTGKQVRYASIQVCRYTGKWAGTGASPYNAMHKETAWI